MYGQYTFVLKMTCRRWRVSNGYKPSKRLKVISNIVSFSQRNDLLQLYVESIITRNTTKMVNNIV